MVVPSISKSQLIFIKWTLNKCAIIPCLLYLYFLLMPHIRIQSIIKIESERMRKMTGHSTTGYGAERTEQVKSGINQYRRSKFSVADDDRLRQHVKDIPSNIILSVSVDDYDFIGNPCYLYMCVEKIAENSWKVKEQEHWAFEAGVLVSDSIVARSLLYLFRFREIVVNVVPSTAVEASNGKI